MAAKVNILIDQGATFTTSYTILDDSDQPVDFTTYTGQSQMRKTYTSSNSHAFTVGLHSNGQIDLAMTANTTASIVAGRYLYDVEVVASSGIVSRLVEGIATITPNITR